MCGIAGFWLSSKERIDRDAVLAAMTSRLTHRGPDDSGFWQTPEGLGLGHRRLSVIDLSPDGHQPMCSASGRYVIAYNGEVYNFQRLRREIDAETSETYPFRGHSDTEVILAAIETWGLEAAIERFIGMFAFVLWDREERRLVLVRDRLGIKPLYYGWHGSTFLFGSELKAIRAFPGFAAKVDRAALGQYLRYSSVPGSRSIFQGIRKVTPGTIVSISDPTDPNTVISHRYWSPADVADRCKQAPFAGDQVEAQSQLESLLMDAVGLRMLADVPVGAFLSGGIDSSLVVSLMQAQSSRPVETFSIGFEESLFDEAINAKEVARYLSTNHTELYVSPADASTVIPKLPEVYDEPFADSSQIPTYLVSSLARKNVTVVLSGDGGDELFGGYNRHVWGPRVWRALRASPRSLKQLARAALTSRSPADWDSALRGMSRTIPARYQLRLFGEKLHKLAGLVECRSMDDLYQRLTSQTTDPIRFVYRAEDSNRDFGCEPQFDHFTEMMMYRDLVSYLPDDILTKVDRASMSASLETRVPLLDHRIAEFAWALPLRMKVRNGTGKWILRQLLYARVPRSLVERPKMGFGIPIGDWLRGPLRPWAEDLLADSKLEREGFLARDPVHEVWSEHLSGRRNHQHLLWNLLMFQAWVTVNGPCS